MVTSAGPLLSPLTPGTWCRVWCSVTGTLRIRVMKKIIKVVMVIKKII